MTKLIDAEIAKALAFDLFAAFIGVSVVAVPALFISGLA